MKPIIPLCAIGMSLALSSFSSVSAKITLKMMVIEPPNLPFHEDMVKDWNRNHPDVQVKLTYVPTGEAATKLRTLMAAGQAPDVCEWDRYKIAEFANMELFAQIDKYVPKAKDVSKDYIPAVYQEASWKGKLYGIPAGTDIRGIFWNKRLLEQAGLDSIKGPREFDDLLTYSKKLTKRGSDGKFTQIGLVPWQGNWGVPGWLWSFGGDYYDVKNHKPAFVSPQNIKAYEYMGNWAKLLYNPTQLSQSGLNAWSALATERVGLEFMHYGAVSSLYDKLLEKGSLGGGVSPHPDGGENGTWCGGFSYVIPAGSKYKTEAGKFIEWATSQEKQMDAYKQLKTIPPTQKGLQMVIEKAEPLEKVFLTQLNEAKYRRPFTSILEPYLWNARTAVIGATKSAEAALKEQQDLALRQHPSVWSEKISFKGN